MDKSITVPSDIDTKKAIEMKPVSDLTGVPLETLYENYDEVKKELNWKPKIDFEEGVKRYIKWYKTL